jgi:hypothetical protein
VLADISRHPGIVEVLTQIIGPNVKMMQSMLFINGPGKPGQAWHQDEGHIPTRDRSLTGVWIALDDASVDNGCMWVIPGSHRPGVLYPVRHHHDRRFDPTPEAHGFDHEDHAVPVEVPAGGVVFFNGYLLHRSLPNERPGGHRRALVNHYMSCESLLPWLPPGSDETMATLDMRDIVLVAGHDPHASKGVVDIMRPRLRADSAVDESAPPGTYLAPGPSGCRLAGGRNRPPAWLSGSWTVEPRAARRRAESPAGRNHRSPQRGDR